MKNLKLYRDWELALLRVRVILAIECVVFATTLIVKSCNSDTQNEPNTNSITDIESTSETNEETETITNDKPKVYQYKR